MPVTGKSFRRRRADSESEEDEQDSEEVRLKLEETREVQNLRKRPNGVRGLTRRWPELCEEQKRVINSYFYCPRFVLADLFSFSCKGCEYFSWDSRSLFHQTDSSSALCSPKAKSFFFLMKYIETELKKRKGIVEHEEQKVKPKNAEDCLYELPENIRVSSAKKTEEMLSNQMLSGIPEVDLGIDAKIKNIISTEDAKARLLAEQQNKKKDSETSFVPTNMAVNYVQHNRCKLLWGSSPAPLGRFPGSRILS
uniref:Chromosome 9 open reading frame 78 n=1 Tax=Mustela putorius furo TaxID=9669 RepID=M3YN71_MUSPF